MAEGFRGQQVARRIAEVLIGCVVVLELGRAAMGAGPLLAAQGGRADDPVGQTGLARQAGTP